MPSRLHLGSWFARRVGQLATVLFDVFTSANWHVIVQLTLLKLLALSLLIALNARTLLADLLGVDPGIFRSSAATRKTKPTTRMATTTTATTTTTTTSLPPPNGFKKQTGGLGSLTWALGSTEPAALDPEPLGPVIHSSSHRSSKALAASDALPAAVKGGKGASADDDEETDMVVVRDADGEVYPFRSHLVIASGLPGVLPVQGDPPSRRSVEISKEGEGTRDGHLCHTGPPPRGPLAPVSLDTVDIDDQLDVEDGEYGACAVPTAPSAL